MVEALYEITELRVHPHRNTHLGASLGKAAFFGGIFISQPRVSRQNEANLSTLFRCPGDASRNESSPPGGTPSSVAPAASQSACAAEMYSLLVLVAAPCLINH